MRHKHISTEAHTNHLNNTAENSPQIENAVMKLVVDSYLQGAQTCELHDGKVLGVIIHHGDVDNIRLYIDNNHKITVEVKNGSSRVSDMANKDEEDMAYVLPFTKCLGLSESMIMKNYAEI
ncbi:hypothetical protein ACFO26_07865 [Lactococcus nasutitermitis]|uniref:Uncharacterized protein n=1 Tax=Lactococcus nasutitermitis TaxID=1652957 RepID=A0ABV9JHE7_9LACT|nr:hypothetical protein [Lactococcus nasutitermitis]